MGNLLVTESSQLFVNFKSFVDISTDDFRREKNYRDKMRDTNTTVRKGKRQQQL